MPWCGAVIFLTVGSQSPFDRLVRCVDDWNRLHKLEITAQIGDGTYEPRHLNWFRFCPSAAYRAYCQEAEFIVAHAGMGAILTGMEFGRGLLLFPRRADRRETRNDHQSATSNWMSDRPGVTVALDEAALQAALSAGPSISTGKIPSTAPPALVQALRSFIANE